MRLLSSITLVPAIATFLSLAATTSGFTNAHAAPITNLNSGDGSSRNISTALFLELEELARLVDISYCVGVSGIWKPFQCVSRCEDFPGFELVDTWNTGPLLSDSCGYIALDHTQERIIVAFRGTYSIASTIADLTTIPQEYVPYPGDPDSENEKPKSPSWWQRLRRPWGKNKMGAVESAGHQDILGKTEPKCHNCTVHSGFLRSWQNTRDVVLPRVLESQSNHPSYTIHLVGHSLGGAVAALAGLEMKIKGLSPIVTTFGEPRIGNAALRDYLDMVFHLKQSSEKQRYRRITHKGDPVPLLPLTEWGYKMHAGEIYISKKHLTPEVSDVQFCDGDEDLACIAGGEPQLKTLEEHLADEDRDVINEIISNYGLDIMQEWVTMGEVVWAIGSVQEESWGIPERLKMWHLFFAHRDYFWRLGLCVPGGDPKGWLGHPLRAAAVAEL